MTRQGNNQGYFGRLFGSLGSISKNAKRLTVLAALMFSSQLADVEATEAKYQVKIHKNFMKEVIDKNFPVILRHLENQESKNKYLTEINANVDEFTTNIQPKKESGWEDVKSDLFIDQGEIVMELENLEFAGDGLITDPDTGIQEKIKMVVDMDLCQIVMRLGEEVQDGYLYPKVEIKDVAFTLNSKTFNIDGEGDLPLYKKHKFEEGIKKWFQSQLKQKENDFLRELQRSEREIMATFAFKKEIVLNEGIGELLGSKQAHSSLSEQMKLQGEHIIINYMTEFELSDQSSTARSMRNINPSFSEDPEHQRDVQVVIDENQINYYLFSLFYADKPFSMTEKILEILPEWMEEAAFMVHALMNAQTFSPFFPELRHHGTKRIDLKCNLDKQSLLDGKLEELQMSQVRFKKDNKIDMDLHFGCSIWLYEEQLKMPEMTQLMGFILDLYDNDPNKWTKWRSFYISMNTIVELDFSEDAKRVKIPGEDWMNNLIKTFTGEDKKYQFPKMSAQVPLIFGRINDFSPNIHELKVFAGDIEVVDEADALNKAIMDAKTHEFWENPLLQPFFEFFFGHTIPLAPFPQVEGCLGLRPKDSEMAIKEGFAVMSYDYQVDRSTTSCLFEMQDTKLQREAKKLQRKQNSLIGKAGNQIEKLLQLAQKQVASKLQPEVIQQLIQDPTVQKVAKIATDENVHKVVKEGFDNVAKGLDNLFNKGKEKKGLFSFMQN